MGCQESKAAVNSGKVDLSHFALERVIGQGGFGQVRAATKKEGGTLTWYAIKMQRKRTILSSKGGPLSVFVELRTLSQLSHPNICNAHYAFGDDENVYLVLDIALGGDLRYLLRQQGKGQALAEPQVRFYAAQLLLGLDYLHRHNMLHRDIKPDNILLMANGYVKLTDFGVSAELDNVEDCTASSGTPGYMAPEIVAKGHRHGTASEWFALGVALHELLTGRRPYSHEAVAHYATTGGGLNGSGGIATPLRHLEDELPPAAGASPRPITEVATPPPPPLSQQQQKVRQSQLPAVSPAASSGAPQKGGGAGSRPGSPGGVGSAGEAAAAAAGVSPGGRPASLKKRLSVPLAAMHARGLSSGAGVGIGADGRRASASATSGESPLSALRLTPACRAFLRGVLAMDVGTRLGSAGSGGDGGGFAALQGHAWLAGTDWAATARQAVPAPFVPNTKQANCETGKFDIEDVLLGGASAPGDPFGGTSGRNTLAPLSAEEQALFDGYSFNVSLAEATGDGGGNAGGGTGTGGGDSGGGVRKSGGPGSGGVRLPAALQAIAAPSSPDSVGPRGGPRPVPARA